MKTQIVYVNSTNLTEQAHITRNRDFTYPFLYPLSPHVVFVQRELLPIVHAIVLLVEILIAILFTIMANHRYTDRRVTAIDIPPRRPY